MKLAIKTLEKIFERSKLNVSSFNLPVVVGFLVTDVVSVPSIHRVVTGWAVEVPASSAK